ncbi:predicted protein [Thalassiosira pseudonana CCMP1335]|uniref:Ubiquinone biosynthesis protein n=1 Tax=Thalassiosira pseudonana TaxID=35128 RepID=B8BVJ1_THAPS|nr:predicted protein [Thalassiosira pseudonana CCMP1335]EED95471.1 predicted protein [Thalassiosira pseudonana CCMP1335]|eukprot:scaffold13948_cov207-Alexandrium_tamarense.AAC.1
MSSPIINRRIGSFLCLQNGPMHSSTKQSRSAIASLNISRAHHSRATTCVGTTQYYSHPASTSTFTSSVPSNRLLSSSINSTIEQRKHSILTHALQRVHDEGWTDEAIASGTLDAGLPPSYIGQASSSTSLFGSADLVSFFMEECNASLKRKLELLKNEERNGNVESMDAAERIFNALQVRLSMVLPFVATHRWHEGMAIGALPQNVFHTAQQLDEMARIVLDYAVVVEGNNNTQQLPFFAGQAQRATIVAAYAAAELHLLSEGMKSGRVSGSSISYTGDRYNASWAFLKERCNEAARLLSNKGGVPLFLPSGVPLNTTHLAAASAVASSLAGAALSLAAPSAAALAGQALPQAMSVLAPLQSAFVGGHNATANNLRDGTRPSDYQVNDLPPFDTSEVIFEGNGKSS